MRTSLQYRTWATTSTCLINPIFLAFCIIIYYLLFSISFFMSSCFVLSNVASPSFVLNLTSAAVLSKFCHVPRYVLRAGVTLRIFESYQTQCTIIKAPSLIPSSTMFCARALLRIPKVILETMPGQGLQPGPFHLTILIVLMSSLLSKFAKV